MSSKQIIAVLGSTGVQGGSVAQYLLKDGTFVVRAITRNPDSPAGKALVSQGAQVVQADSNDPVTLLKAFEGVHGVYGLTDFFSPGVGFEGEVTQGKQLVNAAKAAGVKHFIWSTLDHFELYVPHRQSKAEVDGYLKASGLPRTSLYTCFYFENFTKVLPLKKRDDGSYDFPMPLITDAPLAIYLAGETGAYALAAFKNAGEWLNKDMRVVPEFLSARQIAEVFSDVSGKTVHVQEITPEQFEKFKNNPIPETMHSSFKASHSIVASFTSSNRDHSQRLNPGRKAFRAWVEENVTKILT